MYIFYFVYCSDFAMNNHNSFDIFYKNILDLNKNIV